MRTIFNRPASILVKGKLINLDKPLVMAVLNITPDSFYGGSRISSVQDALDAAEKFVEEGADILDVGAYSSRPGAEDISAEAELERLIPVISAIANRYPETIISVDTFRSKVAGKAVAAGAGIVNDISGGELDPDMFTAISGLRVPYILMHMRGNPQNMAGKTQYKSLIPDMLDYFSEKIARLRALGVHDIILDPGFGFAKTSTQSYAILNRLEDFKIPELPLLAGFSRKSIIYKALGTTPEDALNGTTVLNTIALMKGADILRVHDVKEARECITLIERLKTSKD